MAGISLISTSFLWLALGAAAAFDFRSRRVPNAISLPLLALAIARAFPGDPLLYGFTALLITAWRTGFLGGGDAKLWIASAWWFAPDFAAFSPPSFFPVALAGLTMLLTAAFQRIVLPPSSSPSPGAWRLLVYAALTPLTLALL